MICISLWLKLFLELMSITKGDVATENVEVCDQSSLMITGPDM